MRAAFRASQAEMAPLAPLPHTRSQPVLRHLLTRRVCRNPAAPHFLGLCNGSPVRELDVTGEPVEHRVSEEPFPGGGFSFFLCVSGD